MQVTITQIRPMHPEKEKGALSARPKSENVKVSET